MSLFLVKVKRLLRPKTIFIFCCVFFMVAIIAKPEVYIASVLDGFKLFCVAVLPGLFPFFFFSKALVWAGIGDYGACFKRPLAALYNAPSEGGYIFLLSILSGYPVGARLIADAYQSGSIDTPQAKTLTSFTSTSAPLFIIGAVSVGMFADKKLGYLLLLCHYLSALFNGLFYRRKSPQKPSETLPHKQTEDLSDCVQSSLLSLISVGGYIALMSMIIDVMAGAGIIKFLALPIAKLVQSISSNPALAEAIVSGAFEVTKGCLLISGLGLDVKVLLPLLSILISFGGLCIILQSVTFLKKCNIKVSFIIKTKFTQALLAGAFALLIGLLL